MSLYKKVPGKCPERIKTKGEIGEDLVTELSTRAYLKYWCYPNPIDINGNKNEICDLLIIFFDTIIIISVKNYDLKGNYERYKNRVVKKSTKQLFGAERKLFKKGNLIEIAHPDKGNEKFNPDKIKNVFRITVSVGESFENYEFVDNEKGKGCINILNKETFEIITNELDTIKDLVEYLEARENLLNNSIGKLCNCTEKDLLAHFLMNRRTFAVDLFQNFEKETEKLKGIWENYLKNRSVIIKKLVDEKSYFIDKIVEEDILPLENGEELARELMTLSRFERRIITHQLFSIVEKYKDKKDFLGRVYTEHKGTGFLFLYYPPDKSKAEVNLIVNQIAPESYAYKHKVKKIVVLASTNDLKEWKFGLYIAGELSEKDKERLDAFFDKAGWFKNENRRETEYKEYPDE